MREAVKKYGKKIAVGIDALDGKVAADGWTEQSQVDCIELAKRMEEIGVHYIICTDIYKDGTMNGPNLVMLDKLNRSGQLQYYCQRRREQPFGYCKPV